jgi:hypothetical protein
MGIASLHPSYGLEAPGITCPLAYLQTIEISLRANDHETSESEEFSLGA